MVEREGAISGEAIAAALDSSWSAWSGYVLAIETSCDETAAAVVSDTYEVRSSVVASQIDLHAEFGGVVPELASRAHVELITALVDQALAEAGHQQGPSSAASRSRRDPGLVGALLVGIATAKSLALGWGLPIVGVNHLDGHLASVFLANREVPFPQTALLVSGGHCMLTRARSQGDYELLGETVDDSIGEAYDKVARYLGLGYPGGPVLDRLAASGRDVLNFPRPMLADGYEFSFSGLKTAVVNYVRKEPGFVVADVAASFVAACMDVLCVKIRRALEEFGDPALAVVGGVAASPILRERAQAIADEFGSQLVDPAPVAGHRQRGHDRHRRVAEARGTRRGRPVVRSPARPTPALLRSAVRTPSHGHDGSRRSAASSPSPCSARRPASSDERSKRAPPRPPATRTRAHRSRAGRRGHRRASCRGPGRTRAVPPSPS